MPRGKSLSVKNLAGLSVQELEALLEGKRAERVNELQARSAVLNKALSLVNAELATLGAGAEAVEEKPRKVATVAAETAKKPGRRPRKRAARGEVKKMIVDVLKEAGKPLRLKEIMSALDAKGFRSSSKNPTRLVNGYLIQKPEFTSVSKGVYKLTESK